MLALRLLGIFSCLSAIYAAPIPEPVNPGDIVKVAPGQATTAYGDSSGVPHPGVVLGAANTWGKHQVAIITNHPPSTHDQKHQLLSDFKPGHGLSATSHVGTSHPATYHGSQLSPWTGGGAHHAPLAPHELTALKDKIHENNPNAVWKHGSASTPAGTAHNAHNAAAGSSTAHHQPAAAPAAPAAGRGRPTLRGAARAVVAGKRFNPMSQGGRKPRK